MGYGYGYGYGLYGLYGLWDPTFLLVIIGAIICLIASARMRTTFNKYTRVRSMSGMNGAQTAERILRHAGIRDVRVVHIQGNLNDHYDPRNKTLSLSDSVYNSVSVAAVGVAAHECGHAIQHAKGYVPLRIRGSLVPVANFGSTLAWPLIIIGVLFGNGSTNIFIEIGILLFSLAVLFQLVTLPVEFNASHRAMRLLEDTGILGSGELRDTRKVLTAAALTYVASAAAIILQLLRLLLLFGGRGRND